MVIRFTVNCALLAALSSGTAMAQDAAQDPCNPTTAIEQVGVNDVHAMTQISEGRAAFRFTLSRNTGDQGAVIDVVRPAQTYRGDSISADDIPPIALTICKEAGRTRQQVFPATPDGLAAAVGLFGPDPTFLIDGMRFAVNEGPGTYVGFIDSGPDTEALEVFVRPRQLGVTQGLTERPWNLTNGADGRQSINDGPLRIGLNDAIAYRFRTSPDERRNAMFSLYGHEAEDLPKRRELGEMVDPLPDPVLTLLEHQEADDSWIDVAGNDDAEGLPSRFDSRMMARLKPDTAYALVATSLNGAGTYSLSVEIAPPIPFAPTPLAVGGSASATLQDNAFEPSGTREHIFAIQGLEAGRYVLEVSSADLVFLELGLENPFAGPSQQEMYLPAKRLGSTRSGQRVTFDVPQAGRYLLSLRDRETTDDDPLSQADYGSNITVTLRRAALAAPRPQ